MDALVRYVGYEDRHSESQHLGTVVSARHNAALLFQEHLESEHP